MRSGGNNFHYFSKNKLTKMANIVQFKRMLMFCLHDWGGAGPLGPPLSTPLVYREDAVWLREEFFPSFVWSREKDWTKSNTSTWLVYR